MTDETQPSSAVNGSNISAARELQAGDYLGHYRIEQKLGEGGMGAVYKAYEEALGRFVAIKVLSRRVAADEKFAQRFLVEARAVGALNHPNIIQIYFIGQQEGLLFFAMEFVEGNSLESVLEQRKQLPAPEAVSAILYAALGLQEAHANSIIHRDIKPANLMLTRKGEIKIADFGLAKRVTTDPAFSAHLTGTHVIMGTPNYISPEQARGLPADHRSDIYSLGCTLYNLLAGRPPFLGETAMDIMLHHIQTPPLPIQQSAPDVPEALNPILAMMLAKDPNARYQTYDELIADLNAFLAGQTPAAAAQLVLSSAPPAPIRAQTAPVELVGAPSPTRKRIRTAVYAVALVFIVAGLAWSLWDSYRMRSQRIQHSPSTAPSPISETQSSQTDAAVDDPARWKDAINLLSLIDPKQDLNANWKKRGEELESVAVQHNAFSFPYTPPQEYDFLVEFTRLHGNDSLNLNLVKGGRQFTCVLGGWENMVIGFQLVGSKWANDNPTAKWKEGEWISNRMRYQAWVEVRENSAKVFLDGKLISTWNSGMGELGETRGSGFGLSSVYSVYQVHRAQVLELNGEGIFKRPDDPAAKEAAKKRDEAKRRAAENAGDPARWVNAIALLPLIDVQDDRVYGRWEKQGNDIVALKDLQNRMEIPYRPPEEYDFRITFTRREGNDTVGQILNAQGHSFLWMMGVMGNKRFGFEAVRRIGAVEGNSTTRDVPSCLETGRRHTSIVQVRKDGVKAFLDGQLISEYKTDFKDMALMGGWALRDPTVLALASYDVVVAFHRADVLEITGKGEFTRPDDAAAKEAEKKRSAAADNVDDPARWKNAVDLLKMIDAKKHAVNGQWKWENGALVSDATAQARLEIPYQPPDEYDFRVVCRRLEGDDTMGQVVSKSGRAFMWELGGYKNTIFGFEVIANTSAINHPHAVKRLSCLEKGREYTSTVQVRNDGVKAFVNGELICQWKTDYSDMSMFPDWKLRDDRFLGLFTHESPTAFSRIELLELTGKGKKFP